MVQHRRLSTMSYYYDECEYSEEPVYYAPEPVDYEPEPIYYDPDIYGSDSNQHPTGFDFDNGCEEPIYYDPSIYGFENGPNHFPEPLFDGEHSEPTCSDHAEPLHMDDKTQPPEFQYEPEPAPIPRYNDLPQHYQDWHWLASILRQLQEVPTTYDDLPDDEWELAIAHDNQLFESRMADATTLSVLKSGPVRSFGPQGHRPRLRPVHIHPKMSKNRTGPIQTGLRRSFAVLDRSEPDSGLNQS